MSEINQILQQYWGYDAFRPGQEDIINSILQKQDTLALLPTGGGKSICYQVPGLALGGTTLVVSPLIALMNDQVQNLQKRNISAKALTSELSYRELDALLENAIHNQYQFLFVSPERLKTDLFLARLQRMKISLLAIDEAHCISQWGYDFRPSYLSIAEIKEFLPGVPTLALTATATPEVVKDICHKLHFKDEHIIQSSFKRDNLAYVVRKTAQKTETLLKIIHNVGGSGVVYCGTRKATQYWADQLKANNVSAAHFHAGLTPEQKLAVQQSWIDNQTQVICATNAFGMGIDKPDVRFVVHVTVPDSIEGYFQEAGRGGRDRKKAFASLLYHEDDLARLDQHFQLAFPTLQEVRRVYQALGNFLGLATGSGLGEAYEVDLKAISERYDMKPMLVYHCIKFLEKEELLQLSESANSPSRLRIVTNQRNLYSFKVAHPELSNLIDLILRSYPGCFEEYVSINEDYLARKLQIDWRKVTKQLQYLNDRDLIDFTPRTEKPKVIYLKERLPEQSIRLSEKNYDFLKQKAAERLEAMKGYVTASSGCRSQLLLSYFGETESEVCGICDLCIEAKKNSRELSHWEKLVMSQLKTQKRTLEELYQVFSSADTDEISKAVNALIDSNYLRKEENYLIVL